jgi:two-component system, NarL family, nitrate/nitrite response regulator NarL
MSSLTIQKLNADINNLNAEDRDLLLQSFALQNSIKTQKSLKKERFIDEIICSGEIVRELIVDCVHYYLVRCDETNDTEGKIRLSPREKSIARAIAKGQSSKEISKNLQISFWTVNTYLKRIFIKLNVTTRPAMIAKLMEERLLDEDSVENSCCYLLSIETITDRN